MSEQYREIGVEMIVSEIGCLCVQKEDKYSVNYETLLSGLQIRTGFSEDHVRHQLYRAIEKSSKLFKIINESNEDITNHPELRKGVRIILKLS
ncbi:Uncharacterised protein [uncultured archaeon]|nr:Uncharacterised protein [uncultured archaeon]